jgi:hypothetical protein
LGGGAGGGFGGGAASGAGPASAAGTGVAPPSAALDALAATALLAVAAGAGGLLDVGPLEPPPLPPDGVGSPAPLASSPQAATVRAKKNVSVEIVRMRIAMLRGGEYAKARPRAIREETRRFALTRANDAFIQVVHLPFR